MLKHMFSFYRKTTTSPSKSQHDRLTESIKELWEAAGDCYRLVSFNPRYNTVPGRPTAKLSDAFTGKMKLNEYRPGSDEMDGPNHALSVQFNDDTVVRFEAGRLTVTVKGLTLSYGELNEEVIAHVLMVEAEVQTIAIRAMMQQYISECEALRRQTVHEGLGIALAV